MASDARPPKSAKPFVDNHGPPGSTADGTPASKPAPVGDAAHPGLVLKYGFYFFRDEYPLPSEPTADQAEAAYLDQVERAFQNRWELHPNFIHERDDAQKVKHGYDLDFRENEIKRIRDILPVDAPVFDYIDALVDVVMLRNLGIYVDKRLGAFRRVVAHTRAWLAGALGIGLAGLLLAGFMGLAGPLSLGAASVAGILAAAAVAYWIAVAATWPNLIGLELKRIKERYEEAVRDAAGLTSQKLANKGREVQNLMNTLKNKLETINSPDASRVEQAPKTVRVLLWIPERMGLVENYYRAKMDQFMVKSARLSIDSAVGTQGIIHNRLIFLFTLAIFVVIGLIAAAAIKLGGGAGRAVRAPSSPQGLLIASTAFPLLLSAMAAVTITVSRLDRLSHLFEPQDIAHRTQAIFSGGLRASLLAMAVGLAPLAAILIAPKSAWPAVVVGALVLLLLAIVWFAIPVIYARLIFQRYEALFSSNVLEAVEKKMEHSAWARYSDLRIDQKIAEVFSAIYMAWHKADSKGVYSAPA